MVEEYYLKGVTDAVIPTVYALLDNQQRNAVYDLRDGMGIVAVYGRKADIALFCELQPGVSYTPAPQDAGEEDAGEPCAYCHRPGADGSGFCSEQCERDYGSCPMCGAPSRRNRVCWDCREP